MELGPFMGDSEFQSNMWLTPEYPDIYSEYPGCGSDVQTNVRSIQTYSEYPGKRLNVQMHFRVNCDLQLAIAWLQFSTYFCYLSLPENPRMPSARFFAECRISSTRQRNYLSSAHQKALGEQLALSGINLCRVPASWHSAKPLFAECWPAGTRQSPSLLSI